MQDDDRLDMEIVKISTIDRPEAEELPVEDGFCVEQAFRVHVRIVEDDEVLEAQLEMVGYAKFLNKPGIWLYRSCSPLENAPFVFPSLFRYWMYCERCCDARAVDEIIGAALNRTMRERVQELGGEAEIRKLLPSPKRCNTGNVPSS